MYTIIETKTVPSYGTIMYRVKIAVDTAEEIPTPLDEWAAGSEMEVYENEGSRYKLGINREWYPVNFKKGSGGGDISEDELNQIITDVVSEIVAGAPEDFDTLKEMSDWLLEHEDSAAAMNTAIQKNTSDIAKKLDKTDIIVLTQSEYDSLTEKTAPFYFIKEGETV